MARKLKSNAFAAARRNAGLDQSEFGERVGYGAGRISQWEGDPSTMPLGIASAYYGIASEGIKLDIEGEIERRVFARV